MWTVSHGHDGGKPMAKSDRVRSGDLEFSLLKLPVLTGKCITDGEV